MREEKREGGNEGGQTNCNTRQVASPQAGRAALAWRGGCHRGIPHHHFIHSKTRWDSEPSGLLHIIHQSPFLVANIVLKLWPLLPHSTS